MSEANVFRLRHLEDGLSELWQTADNLYHIYLDTPNLSCHFRIEMMTWLVFYGGVLLLICGCARYRAER